LCPLSAIENCLLTRGDEALYWDGGVNADSAEVNYSEYLMTKKKIINEASPPHFRQCDE
jgi:hypothetical protein